MRRILLVLAVLLFAGVAIGEMQFTNIAATSTVQTAAFPRPVQSAMLCNYGPNEAYFRLFNEFETPADAVVGTSAVIDPGAAGNPVCISASLPTGVPKYASASIICEAAETATMTFYGD